MPVPHPVAVAVAQGRPVDGPLAAAGLAAAADWPHDDTADALRPLAEYGAPGDLGTWLVTTAGRVVGDCGWFGPPDEEGAVEIGYGLARSARGQGLGTEAVGVLCAWVERQPGVRLVTTQVLVGNEASVRLLARLGFAEDGSRSPYLRLVRPAPGAVRPVRGRHVC